MGLMYPVLKKIFTIYKPFRWAIFTILFFMFITTALELAWPYLYGQTIDAIILRTNINSVFYLLILAFAAMLTQNLVSFLQAKFEVKYFDFDSPSYLQDLTLKKLLSLSIGQHRNEHSGLTQTVVNEGQNSVRDLVDMIAFQIAPYMVRIPLALIVLFLLSWQVGLVVLACVILSFIAGYFSNKYVLPFVRKERDMYQDYGKKRSEMLRNAPLVIISAEEKNAEDEMRSEAVNINNFSKGFWSKFVYFSYIVRPSISNLAVISAMVVSTYLVFQGQISTGSIVTVMFWTNMTVTGLGLLSRLQRQLVFSSERAKRYLGLIDLETDVALSKNATELARVEGEIVFDDVSFVYPRKRIIEEDPRKAKNKKVESKAPQEALHNVSFKINPDEHVAFVGASGAGKSTMTLLMLRGSDPTSGNILVDGINLKEIEIKSYRQNVGIVEQFIVLFDDTLRKNISFGLGGGELLSDERLEELAKICRLDEFKDKLTDGWDTIIGENGIKLSGGQRQRVGIARALAKDPKILILDEATSSLDAKNEALIKEAIKDASHGRTTITIAHRLSTIKDADRIFVFDKGTIVGVGKHDELLKTCKEYKELVSHQTVLL
ncbi:MAG: ABC transporter ATP-binding protein [Minisyncoccia bacterium]